MRINKEDMEYYKYLNIEEYPKMKIIGECELVDCIYIDDKFDKELSKNKNISKYSIIEYDADDIV